MNVYAFDLVGNLLRRHIGPFALITRHQGAQKRTRSTGRVERVKRPLKMQVVHHPFTQPIGRVVLAQGMAGIDVDQFLVNAFQNVFLDIGEVVL